MRFQEFSQFKIRPHLFENKQQYKQIMDTMINADIIDQNEAQNLLKTVKSLLKRADRIIWWLRWFRLDKTGEVIENKTEMIKRQWELKQKRGVSSPDTPETEEEVRQKIDELENLYKKITKKDYNYYLDNSIPLYTFNDNFNLRVLNNHWATMFEQSPQVNQVEWSADLSPSDLFQRLERAEEEWKQKQQEELEPEPDDQIIIDYGKYAWVKLDREYCELEGRAMGHCGNTGTPQEGDRILSFRTKVDGGKQRPHLTFILDKNGYLGEMKGRGNDKPSEKYHPYIIDLLKKDFVKGIKGGGYMPENNFDLSDLDDQTREELVEQKPELGSSYDMLKAGKTEEFYEKLESELDAFDLYLTSLQLDTENNRVIFDRETSPDRLYGVVGLDSADLIKRISGLFNGETDIRDIYDYPREIVYDKLEDVADDLYEGLSEDEQQALKEFVKKNYEDIDPNESSIEEIISEVDEIDTAFRNAVLTGMEMGDEAEIANSFNDWLEESGITHNSQRDTYEISAPADDVSKAIHNRELAKLDTDSIIRQFLDIEEFEEPYNGWHGDFDMDAATERLVDELSSEGVT